MASVKTEKLVSAYGIACSIAGGTKRIGDARDALLAHIEELEGWYYELLYAVATKYPNESRHQAALRYIHEHESRATSETKQEKQ